MHSYTVNAYHFFYIATKHTYVQVPIAKLMYMCNHLSISLAIHGSHQDSPTDLLHG